MGRGTTYTALTGTGKPDAELTTRPLTTIRTTSTFDDGALVDDQNGNVFCSHEVL